MGSFLCKAYQAIKVLLVLGIFGSGCAFFGFIFFMEMRPGNNGKPLPSEYVLHFTLEQVVEESSNNSPFRYLGKGHPIALRTFIESLERARQDKAVRGLVIKASDIALNLSHAEEMRSCLARFKASGKFVTFHTDSFGEYVDAGALYYLASVSDEIWVQPSGSVTLSGLSYHLPFLKSFLDLAGLRAEIAKRHEFKAAPDMFLRKEISELQSQSEKRLLAVMQNQIDQGAAEGRQIKPAVFDAIRNFRPLRAAEAFEQKLITHLGYWSDCIQNIKGSYKEIPWIKFTDYIDRLDPIESDGQKIALIVIDGEIERGETSPFDGAGGSSIGGDTVAKAIRQAAADAEVNVILIRIDSPGGSYIASDTMWYEVLQAKKAGKKVVASLGSVAASGGYFVAMAADKIICNASTITGSIGAYSGKYIAEELAQKIGVNFASLGTAENASMMSPFKAFTPQQWEIINHELDVTYQDFTTKFQQSRNFPAVEVDKVARGRVFAGSEAITLGLVDKIGGYFDAVVEAKKMANIPLNQPAAIQLFPRRKTFAERFMQYFEDADEVSQFIRTTRDQVRDLKRQIRGARNQIKLEMMGP